LNGRSQPPRALDAHAVFARCSFFLTAFFVSAKAPALHAFDNTGHGRAADGQPLQAAPRRRPLCRKPTIHAKEQNRMIEKRATIKDIAEELHVSSGTVHRALNDKPGVGEDLRLKIRKAADEMGYRPNYYAATLKMNPLRIAVAFPGEQPGSELYYRFLWEGYRERLKKYADCNLDVVELPLFQNTRPGAFSQEMEKLLQGKERLDGVLAGGLTIDEGAMVQRLHALGIPVVMLSEGIQNAKCLCTVESDHYTDGQVAGELLRMRVPAGSNVLVCAGAVQLQSNADNVRGFLDMLGSDYSVQLVYGVYQRELLRRQVAEILQKGNVRAAYSVAARTTPPLLDAMRDTGLEPRICAIGSDLFPESIQGLNDGLLDYVIYKNPKGQGARGLDVLLAYLLRHDAPKEDHICINSTIVVRSNLKYYL
jgi:LacI family transcriptional regulator